MTAVWWDLEKVPLPEDYDCSYTAENISIALLRVVDLTAYPPTFFPVGCGLTVSPRQYEAFRATMNSRHFDCGESPETIIIQGIEDRERKYPMTKNYLIISDDFEPYKPTFELLQSRNCQIMIAHNQEELNAPFALAQWQFSDLIRGKAPIRNVGMDIECVEDDDSETSFPNLQLPLLPSFSNIDPSTYRGVKSSIWWDIESCPVPPDCEVAAVPQYLHCAVLQEMLFPYRIAIYTDASRIEPTSSIRLSYDKTSFTFVSAQYTCEEMARAMKKWAENNPPPATCLLISSNESYSTTLKELRTQGYEVLVWHRRDLPNQTALIASASYVWDWRLIAHGPKPYYRSPPSLMQKLHKVHDCWHGVFQIFCWN